MDLKEYCQTLNKQDLFNLALRVCETAIPIWDDFSSKNKLEYRDTVVGLRHEVRTELLNDAISYCHKKTLDKLFGKLRLSDLLNEFSDPIVALQDSDWEIPYAVECIFYSVYNLLEGIEKPVTAFNEPALYVAVNQAVDALDMTNTMTTDQIRALIYK